jgi:hypothetical protein
MVCKLAQIPPEIWMTPPLPNQYARVRNVENGEDVINENKNQTYAFIDEYLEETIKV